MATRLHHEPTREEQARTGDGAHRIERRREDDSPTALQRHEPHAHSIFQMTPHDLFRASPFELMRRFTDEMDRMFEGRLHGRDLAGAWVPALEIEEGEGEVKVRAELPGLRPEDLHLEVNGDLLILRGERKQESRRNEKGTVRSERSYGEFYRQIWLPGPVDPDGVKARMENGILEVEIPMKREKSLRREIPVSSPK